MSTERYFDVSTALTGGYCVVLVRGRRVEGQALFDTANDIASAAALAGLPVLTSDAAIVQACAALGVATALPPRFDRKAWHCEELTNDHRSTHNHRRRDRRRGDDGRGGGARYCLPHFVDCLDAKEWSAKK